MTSTGTAPRLRPRQGADFERAVKKHLERNGYFVVRSAGSKGPVDLVALKAREILLIQAKATDGYVQPADRAELRGLALMLGGTALAARWHKDGRAARTVEFLELTSAGPAGHRPWTPDHGLEAVPR
jgi:Holliday junction resolvase